MSQTDPTELLAAVQAFLRQQVLPQLQGFDAYTTRVAANSLSIVSRELRGRDAITALDAAAGARWLGGDSSDNPARDISLALRARSLAPDADLQAYLRTRTLRQMAIDNPRYSGFRLGCERWPALAAAAGIAGQEPHQ
ncbi:DUF6285 domain-containing protein [Haliea sp.]